VGWHIKDPLLQKVINIQCGDHGLPPSKASFPLHCAIMAHYFEGGFYPMGGGAAIVKAMTKAIKKYGGTIITGQKVKQILLEGDNKYKAVGIELQNGEIIKAKTVVSNADPAATFKLVGHDRLSEKLRKRLSKTRYSVTSLMFFIIVDMDVRKAGLDSGNIWIMPDRDLDNIYEELKTVDILALDHFPALFISCSSLKDPVSFNGRHHTLEVVTFIDYKSFEQFKDEGENHSAEYLKFKEQLGEKLLNSLEKVLPDIRNHLVHLELGTPLTNEHYINTTRGNVYGTEKDFWQTGPFSYPFKTEIENLFMCGASIISHGVAGASYSGVKAAAQILKCSEDDLLPTDDTQQLQIYDAENDKHWPDSIRNKIKLKMNRFK